MAVLIALIPLRLRQCLSHFSRFAECMPAFQLGNKLVPPRTHMGYHTTNRPKGRFFVLGGTIQMDFLMGLRHYAPMNETFLQRQVIPLVLTVVTCVTLIAAYFGQIHLLNIFTVNDISLQVRWYDVLIGMTIYLKTSIDFAIFIGHLMSRNPGYKSRVSIEIATAVGNALGTMVVLTLWTFFKEIRWLLALMVFIASLVLIKMAEDSLEHAVEGAADKSALKRVAMFFEKGLSFVNKAIAPVLNKIIPHASMKAGGENMRFWPLFAVAFSVPFILGLDDFAGYIPLFNVVNVWGFGIGVFLGHMILNILLYISPSRTIKIVKNPWIAFLGAFAFIALGVWGLYEVIHLIGF